MAERGGRGPVLDLLARALDLGAAAQAAVPGVYAWAVTVLPAAFVRGAPGLARGAAAIGLTSLVLAPFIERKRAPLARVVSIWGLVGTSLVVWVLAPAGWVTASRSDPVRSATGVLAWVLFAAASVAPALPRRPRVVGSLITQPVARRGDSGRLDGAMLGLGVALAGLLQCIGWRIEEAERAVLVRLVGLVAGVMVTGAMASIVVSRHSPRRPLAWKRRLKRAVVPLVLVSLWAAAGAVYALAR